MKVSYDNGAFPIARAHSLDAGYDIRTPIGFTVPAKGSSTVETGVHVQIPEGYVGILQSKSGLNVKHGITGTGTIDAGYTGQITVKLYNHSDNNYVFNAGDKIIQIVFYPIYTPELEVVGLEEFDSSERGNSAFGSSGK